LLALIALVVQPFLNLLGIGLGAASLIQPRGKTSATISIGRGCG
jgi:hypothetical protein